MLKPVLSVGPELDHLEADRNIPSDPLDNRKRRTIRLQKKNDTWGFTIQVCSHLIIACKFLKNLAFRELQMQSLLQICSFEKIFRTLFTFSNFNDDLYYSGKDQQRQKERVQNKHVLIQLCFISWKRFHWQSFVVQCTRQYSVVRSSDIFS